MMGSLSTEFIECVQVHFWSDQIIRTMYNHIISLLFCIFVDVVWELYPSKRGEEGGGIRIYNMSRHMHVHTSQ